MWRRLASALGITRRVDKWIEPLEFASCVGRPEGFRERSRSVVSWLSDLLVVIHADGTKSDYSHEILEPLDTIRIPEFESTQIIHQGYAAGFSRIEAYRHAKDGKKHRAKVTRLPPAMVPGPSGEPLLLEGRGIEFPDLRLGDVLELRYARDFFKPPDQGRFNWEHAFLGIPGVACARRRVTFAVHESRAHEVRLHHCDTPAEEWSARGYRFRRWDSRELAAEEAEDRQPLPRDCEPWVDVSTCPDWAPIGKWLGEHLITRSDSKEAVRRLLAEVAPEGTPAERAARCLDYCRHQVTYGRARGVMPEANAQPGANTAELQRGDCKDQTSLLHELLEEIGLRCRAAAVHAGDPARTGFLPSQRFDHVILACKLDGETLWLDPTAIHVVFGGVVPELEGSPALLVDADGSFEWRTIPVTGAETNRYTYRMDGHFEGRDLVLAGTIEIGGRDGALLRAAELHAPDSVSKGMESLLTTRLGSCTVDRFELEDGWRDRDPLRMEVSLTVPSWIKSAGPDLQLIELPWVGAYMDPTSVARKTRRRTLRIGGPCAAEYTLRLQLPPGRHIDDAALDRRLEGPQHLSVLRGTCREGVLELHMVLETAGPYLAPADYPEFRRFVQDLGEVFDAQHVLAGAAPR